MIATPSNCNLNRLTTEVHQPFGSHGLKYFLRKICQSVSFPQLHSWKIFPTNRQIESDLICFFASVQFSCSVVSDSLWSHESQHARPPCPSPSPGVHSDSCPSSPWCHPAVSSSVVPFSSCLQSFPASKSFPMSQLFTWGGQSTGVSVLASFLPKKSQGWSPCSPRDSQESSPTPQFKSINSSSFSFLHSPTLTSIHDHRKNRSLN